MSPVGELSAGPWIDERRRARVERPPLRELANALRTEIILDLAGLDPRRGFDGVPRPRLLDVGCGDARFLRDVLPHAAPIGVDRSRRAVGVAFRIVPRARYAAGNAVALPFGSDRFHIVTMVDVIGGVEPAVRAAAVREARRVLKPGGRLVVATADRRYPVRRFARLFDDFTDVHLVGVVPRFALLPFWMSAPVVWRLFTNRVRVCDPNEAEIVIGAGVKR